MYAPLTNAISSGLEPSKSKYSFGLLEVKLDLLETFF